MNNIEHDYLKLLHDILHNGIEKDTRNGRTLSIFGRQIRHTMSKGFPLLTTKKMPFRLIATEMMWFLRGDTNIKFLVDNGCHIWDGDAYKNYISKTNEYKGDWPDTMDEFIERIKTDTEFAKKWGELGPVYGAGWRNWSAGVLEDKHGLGNIDQIANLINDLKTNPDSRRLMVNAWNVGELDQMTLPPCHYGFQCYVREGKYLSLMWNQRSVDTFLGLPFNIASYGLLLEIIAKAVGMVPDELIGNLGDVHLYENHMEQAREQLRRETMPLPKLNINTEWWPTESGECGEGPLDAVAIFNGFSNDNFCRCLLEEDLQLSNYQSHPAIKAPLSN
jgi:thymidylate synthase